jgi:hypothetical protein
MRAIQLDPNRPHVHDIWSQARDAFVAMHRENSKDHVDFHEIRTQLGILQEYLGLLCASPDERRLFEEIMELSEAEKAISESLFNTGFQVLDEIHDDLPGDLPIIGISSNSEVRFANELRSQTLAFLQEGSKLSAVQRRQQIRNFIEVNPGHFIQDIHERLSKEGVLSASYATIHSDIRQLESGGEVLTMGHRQGVRRYCFMHPNKLDNRKARLDQLYPVQGLVGKEITNHVFCSKVFARTYLVNHDMRTIALVTPANLSLAEASKVQSFGKLHDWAGLASKIGLYADESVVSGVDGIVVARQVEYTSPGEPEKFSEAPSEWLFS